MPQSVAPRAGAASETAPAAGASGATTAAAGRAVIAHETSRELEIEADAPENGFLLLADTFYPGWTARVDGTPAPLYRANISVRAIPLTRGRHHVQFTYGAPGFVRGLLITLLSVSLLLLWAAGAAYVDWRVRR